MTEFFLQEIMPTWRDGGWVLVPLFFLAVFIFGFGLELYLYLSKKRYHRLSEPVCREWISEPGKSEGEVGEIIRYACSGGKSIGELQSRFSEIRLAEFPRINRRLLFLMVLVAAAPLTGLLGTVFGMLSTFSGLADGTGRVIEGVASGISEALITTQMGLLIAISGYFLIHAIQRKRNQYDAFLARLESLIARRHKEKAQGEIL
ncbi:MAG: MotA/TolQ/ExbB proton channel family protein [Opitutales bacterium]